MPWSDNYVITSFVLPKDHRALLAALARSRGQSMGELLRQLIARELALLQAEKTPTTAGVSE